MLIDWVDVQLAEAKSEIALDTAAPVMGKEKMWLYYSAMDRHDGVWKICLSWTHLDELLRFCE